MKINRAAFIIFLSAFLIGCVSFAAFIFVVRMQEAQSEEKQIAEETKIAVSTPENSSQPKAEATNVQEEQDDRPPNYKIKLLTTGEFHQEDVTAKSGGKWLGLFKENGNYFLQFTKIKVSRVPDPIYSNADLKNGIKTGKKVDVKGNKEPIFLLKNAAILPSKKVVTLFSQNEPDENNSLPNNFARNFNLNGTNYTLKVVSDNPANEYLDMTSKLILVSGNTEQIVHKMGRCDDCGWSLHWVGDLDGDGKLDLYADINDHYNVTSRRLFLSSQAEEGKLVKEVAVFHTVGC
jgi:hypothetical protein